LRYYTSFWLLLIIFLFSCAAAQEAELKGKIINYQQTSDFESLTFMIEIREVKGKCAVESVELHLEAIVIDTEAIVTDTEAIDSTKRVAFIVDFKKNIKQGESEVDTITVNKNIGEITVKTRLLIVEIGYSRELCEGPL